MGRRGPKKEPTALQRLKGFPGKRRHAQEPTPSAARVACPSWLSPEAREEWQRLEPELTRLGLLTDVDVAQFAACCQWYARWRRYETRIAAIVAAAEKEKNHDGDLVTANSGYQQAHPYVVLAAKAADEMRKFAALFGLSPSDRVSLQLPLDPTTPSTHPRPPKPSDEFEQFLKRTRKQRA
jgi:P27 family predicted phage terminase small subunit